jgi:death-on-curing protein
MLTTHSAAALWESLSQKHALVEGKERTAFAALYTFLAIDGVRLSADAKRSSVSTSWSLRGHAKGSEHS